MKRLIAVAAFLPLPLFAGPAEDATLIVKQTFSAEVLSAAFETLRPLLITGIDAELQKSGIILQDSDAFFDLFIAEFQDEYLTTMQVEMVAVYQQIFSEQELHDLAAFFSTPSGQAFLAAQPELMRQGSELGTRVGSLAGQNAGPRVAQRIQSEGLTLSNDPAMMDRLITWLNGG